MLVTYLPVAESGFVGILDVELGQEEVTSIVNGESCVCFTVRQEPHVSCTLALLDECICEGVSGQL